MIDIELEVGQQVTIDNTLCVVSVSRGCKDCVVKSKSKNKSLNGMSMECDTRYSGRTMPLVCSKDDRKDGNNVAFIKVE